MLRTLPPSAMAVVNADDANVRWMAGQTRARVVFIGEAEDAEVRATDIELDWPHGNDVHRPRRRAVVAGLHPADGSAHGLPGTRRDRRRVPRGHVRSTRAVAARRDGRADARTDADHGSAERRFGDARRIQGHDGHLDGGLEAFAEIPARRRIAVFGEISEETRQPGLPRHRPAPPASRPRRSSSGTSKNLQLFRVRRHQGGLARDHIVHARNVHGRHGSAARRTCPGDVVFIKGRWQQALGRVGLALAGRDVQMPSRPVPVQTDAVRRVPVPGAGVLRAAGGRH